MLLLIDSLLSEPPSSITLFRDITLFARVFRDREVLLECSPLTKDLYWSWLKQHGAFDFVEDIVDYDAESGFSIRLREIHDVPGDLNIRRIGYHNFNKIISKIN
tara:strand:- start:16639 stop:16950 length:312 start_codon:yes stop_codon:yes gene_type:complete